MNILYFSIGKRIHTFRFQLLYCALLIFQQCFVQLAGISIQKCVKEIQCFLLRVYNNECKLLQTAPSCSDIIMDCNWLGLTEPCMKYFSFLPTDDGMCCTFNSGKYVDSVLDIESR